MDVNKGQSLWGENEVVGTKRIWNRRLAIKRLWRKLACECRIKEVEMSFV